MRRPVLTTTHTRIVAFAGVLLLAAACSQDPAGPAEPNLGVPISGEFRGTVFADSFATRDFVAGVSGETTVSVCGPAGTNFDIAIAGVDGASATSNSNCEELTFRAEQARRYTVRVTAVTGQGPFNGCYSNVIARCSARVPVLTDPRVPVDYYVTAEGKTGAALIAELHTIAKRGQVVFSYADIRDSMYANIEDPDNDNVVFDVYLGRAASPLFDRATAVLRDINTEHSWPQSRGAGESPALTDVHHLFPADEGANSRRLNHPFGMVTGTVFWTSPEQPGSPGDVSRLGLNAAQDTVFEVRPSRRGDIARALLYFYVRYKLEPTASFTLVNFNIEEATLMAWARADEPSAYERDRHEIAVRVQRNRNPFVDRPDFLDAIGDFPNQ